VVADGRPADDPRDARHADPVRHHLQGFGNLQMALFAGFGSFAGKLMATFRRRSPLSSAGGVGGPRCYSNDAQAATGPKLSPSG
jgi:hypothetical protein